MLNHFNLILDFYNSILDTLPWQKTSEYTLSEHKDDNDLVCQYIPFNIIQVISRPQMMIM